MKDTLEIPKVSVLVPCYNTSDTLKSAVDSITNQSFEALEIILVDDGSTDSSRDILKALAQRDQRVRILSRQHEGIVGALNAGIAECRAQLIARMDADDIAHPTRIEKQFAYLNHHPEVAAVGCLVEGFPPENIDKGFKLYLRWMNRLITHEDIVREIFIESPFAHPSMMLRKGWIDRVGGYMEVEWAEDYDLWLRLYLAGARFGKVPEILLSWREQPERLTWKDKRYSKENFLRAKSHYLIKGPLKAGEAVIVWGASETGRKISRLFLEEGILISTLVDVDPSKVDQEWRGIPIISPDRLPDLWGQLPRPILIAAVAARGARKLIREHLNSMGLVEGQDWWAVA